MILRHLAELDGGSEACGWLGVLLWRETTRIVKNKFLLLLSSKMGAVGKSAAKDTWQSFIYLEILVDLVLS